MTFFLAILVKENKKGEMRIKSFLGPSFFSFFQKSGRKATMLEDGENEKIPAPDMVSVPTAMVKDEVVAKLVAMGFTTRSIS